MTKAELLTIIGQEISATKDITVLQHEREKSLEYYMGG